jgi:hypothetical protein
MVAGYAQACNYLLHMTSEGVGHTKYSILRCLADGGGGVEEKLTVLEAYREGKLPYRPARWCTELPTHLTSCDHLRFSGLPMRNRGG